MEFGDRATRDWPARLLGNLGRDSRPPIVVGMMPDGGRGGGRGGARGTTGGRRATVGSRRGRLGDRRGGFDDLRLGFSGARQGPDRFLLILPCLAVAIAAAGEQQREPQPPAIPERLHLVPSHGGFPFQGLDQGAGAFGTLLPMLIISEGLSI